MLVETFFSRDELKQFIWHLSEIIRHLKQKKFLDEHWTASRLLNLTLTKGRQIWCLGGLTLKSPILPSTHFTNITHLKFTNSNTYFWLVQKMIKIMLSVCWHQRFQWDLIKKLWIFWLSNLFQKLFIELNKLIWISCSNSVILYSTFPC